MREPVYGCCVGSWERFERYVVPKVGDREVIAVAGQGSIATAYNKILSAARGRTLILLHDDLELTDPDAEKKLTEPLDDPDVGLVGVAGGGTRHGLAWWEDEPVGHQWTDDTFIDFGRREGDVTHVEGSVMALSSPMVDGLWFDDDYRGFHGYDEIGSVVTSAGLRVVVVDVDTHHHTRLGFSSAESERLWHEANERFKMKWRVGT